MWKQKIISFEEYTKHLYRNSKINFDLIDRNHGFELISEQDESLFADAYGEPWWHVWRTQYIFSRSSPSPPSIFILFCIYYRIKKPFRKSFCQSILACMGWFINIDYWNLKKHEFKIPVFEQNKKVHPKEISTVQRDKKSEATNYLFRLLRYSGLL